MPPEPRQLELFCPLFKDCLRRLCWPFHADYIQAHQKLQLKWDLKQKLH